MLSSNGCGFVVTLSIGASQGQFFGKEGSPTISVHAAPVMACFAYNFSERSSIAHGAKARSRFHIMNLSPAKMGKRISKEREVVRYQ